MKREKGQALGCKARGALPDGGPIEPLYRNGFSRLAPGKIVGKGGALHGPHQLKVLGPCLSDRSNHPNPHKKRKVMRNWCRIRLNGGDMPSTECAHHFSGVRDTVCSRIMRFDATALSDFS